VIFVFRYLDIDTTADLADNIPLIYPIEYPIQYIPFNPILPCLLPT